MPSGILSDTGKSAKQLAQDIVKKGLSESQEILKEAKKQILSTESVEPSKKPAISKREGLVSTSKTSLPNPNELKQKDLRLLQALEQETKEIQKGKLLDDLQRKIARGEEIYLENIPELSLEEKQVLKAQMEAVQKRQQQDAANRSGLSEPQAKKGRNFFGGKKVAEKQTTRVERPLPPSG